MIKRIAITLSVLAGIILGLTVPRLLREDPVIPDETREICKCHIEQRMTRSEVAHFVIDQQYFEPTEYKEGAWWQAIDVEEIDYRRCNRLVYTLLPGMTIAGYLGVCSTGDQKDD